MSQKKAYGILAAVLVVTGLLWLAMPKIEERLLPSFARPNIEGRPMLNATIAPLGVALSMESMEEASFTCDPSRLPTITNASKSWQAVCESSAGNRYIGVYWKRLTYKKSVFEQELANTFMANRADRTKAPQEGYYTCKQATSTLPEEALKMRSVEMDCTISVLNSTTTLYANLIYSYPVESKTLQANPIIVVSSNSRAITSAYSHKVLMELRRTAPQSSIPGTPLSFVNIAHASGGGSGSGGDGSGSDGSGSDGSAASSDSGTCGAAAAAAAASGTGCAATGVGDSSGSEAADNSPGDTVSPDWCAQQDPSQYFTDQCCTTNAGQQICGTQVRTCANGGLTGSTCVVQPTVVVVDSCAQQDPSQYFTDQCCTTNTGVTRCGTQTRSCANGGLTGSVCTPPPDWCAQQDVNQYFTNQCCTTNKGVKRCGTVTPNCTNGGLPASQCPSSVASTAPSPSCDTSGIGLCQSGTAQSLTTTDGIHYSWNCVGMSGASASCTYSTGAQTCSNVPFCQGGNLWLNNTSCNPTLIGACPGPDTSVTSAPASTAPSAASVPPPPISGTCGSSDGGAFSDAPTTNLCSYTTSSPSVTQSNGQWTWSCTGTDGADQTCFANIIASVTLTSTQARVSPGSAVTLKWAVQNVSAGTCSITANGTSLTETLNSASTDTGTFVTPAVSQTTQFTLTCTDLGGAPVSQSVTVKLIPNIREI